MPSAGGDLRANSKASHASRTCVRTTPQTPLANTVALALQPV